MAALAAAGSFVLFPKQGPAARPMGAAQYRLPEVAQPTSLVLAPARAEVPHTPFQRETPRNAPTPAGAGLLPAARPGSHAMFQPLSNGGDSQSPIIFHVSDGRALPSPYTAYGNAADARACSASRARCARSPRNPSDGCAGRGQRGPAQTPAQCLRRRLRRGRGLSGGRECT